jgi:hypothetical protein
VQPARGLAGELLDVRQERDDVVARGGLDREDALRVELAARCGADLIGGACRDSAGGFHRATHGELDVEPQLESMLVVPQRRELGATVTRDHVRFPRLL